MVKSAISPLQAGIKAACPRCGKGRLYKSVLKPADKCGACELDYSFIDSGDGPAVFVILILGFLILGLALIVETDFHPSLWMHALLWIPTVIIACLWALRFTKALMIALQYQSGAQQNVVIEKD
ncbi:MAG: DUF983 domain-containing protein [Hyphomicrobiales bacterium]|nr:DUF983 domain-containing protein [Hyphomicrobiales bacterium]